ncbi:MAG: hypothetical protein BJ554DRAFT_5640, partial [Olpidium bornovanus]
NKKQRSTLRRRLATSRKTLSRLVSTACDCDALRVGGWLLLGLEGGVGERRERAEARVKESRDNGKKTTPLFRGHPYLRRSARVKQPIAARNVVLHQPLHRSSLGAMLWSSSSFNRLVAPRRFAPTPFSIRSSPWVCPRATTLFFLYRLVFAVRALLPNHFSSIAHSANAYAFHSPFANRGRFKGQIHSLFSA